ncbi:uncharacterized protein LOC143629821 [Bidens hawaiensis]|uniref:uncharacterized protein LOC143629821 n=1 Tax=Bidens hawaiensis TaxID=980011 RepID=UPI004049C758
MPLVTEDNITSVVATSTHPQDDGLEDVEDEHAEFLAKITPYELELADELLWGPHIPLVSSITTTSSAVIDNEDERTSVISKLEATHDDAKVPTTSTVDRDPDQYHGKLRPRKNRMPRRVND